MKKTIIIKLPNIQHLLEFQQHKNQKWQFCLIKEETEEKRIVNRSLDEIITIKLIKNLMNKKSDQLFYVCIESTKALVKLYRTKIEKLNKQTYAVLRNRTKNSGVRLCHSQSKKQRRSKKKTIL